jgi:hypothetical protein
MPGRAYFGLGRGEGHQGQFQPPALTEGPSIGRVRVILGFIAGLVVLWIGYMVHHPEDLYEKCNRHPWKCPPQSDSGLPMIVWLGLGALLTTIVIVWPYLSFAITSRRRRSEHECSSPFVPARHRGRALAH